VRGQATAFFTKGILAAFCASQWIPNFIFVKFLYTKKVVEERNEMVIKEKFTFETVKGQVTSIDNNLVIHPYNNFLFVVAKLYVSEARFGLTQPRCPHP
jgi:hypothetical protein